jgi:GT2 family glycosyltransferase
MGTLVAIVNSLNRLELLKGALVSLKAALEACPFATAIVVFEAGSTDGSRQWLEEFKRQSRQVPIELLYPKEGEETSFSAGVNAACDFASKKYPSAQFYFLFETDNWIENEQSLLEAKRLLESDARLAGVGFTARKRDGGSAGFGCRFPNLIQWVLGRELSHWWGLDAPRLGVCEVVYTSPLLVRKKAWEISGGLDADCFPFSDCDVDWAWRLKRKGFGFAVIKTSQVVHDNQQKISSWSRNRLLYFYQARFCFLERRYGKRVRLLKPAVFLRHVLEMAAAIVLWPFLKDRARTLAKRWALVWGVWRDYQT